MWVICCGMRRSASTLLYQIAERLAVDTGRGIGIGATEDYGEGYMAAIWAKYAPPRQMIVLKTHEFTHTWREELETGQARGLTIYRDLRDALVSGSWNQPPLSLDDDDGLRQRAQWLAEQHRQWAAQPGMLVLTYASFVSDVAACVRAIADHLGLRIAPQWADHLAWAFSIPEQKRRKLSEYWGVRDRIRDGRPGMWREHVTAEQADRIKRIVSEVDAIPCP
jgi:hypothetical protein